MQHHTQVAQQQPMAYGFPQFDASGQPIQPMFPEGAPESPIDAAIRANLEYQTILSIQLEKIKKRRMDLLNNKALLAELNSNYPTSTIRKIPPERRCSLSFFDVGDGTHPADNPDTEPKTKLRQKMPLTYRIRKWTDEESKALHIGIKSQNQAYHRNRVEMQFNQSGRTKEDEERRKREIESIARIDPTLLASNVDHINWEALAADHVIGRSAHECHIRWMNAEAPWIERHQWTPPELRKLRQLAIQNKGHNWHLVSQQLTQELGKHRTSTQCFAKFQRSLNPALTKSKWTEEEDKILTEAVKLYGLKNWGQVANCLEGRTGQQCLHRYQKTLNPEIKKGKWEWEEDRRLQLATAVYGPGKWSYIAQHVPKRTDVQCRERWCNLLAPDISHQQWDDKEDQRLLDIIDRIGVGRWTDVAKEMGSRTDNQCWRRWKTLRRDDVEEYRQRILGYRSQFGAVFMSRDESKAGIAGGLGAGGADAAQLQQQQTMIAQANILLQSVAQEIGVTDVRVPEEYSKVIAAMEAKGGDPQAAARYLLGVAAMQQSQLMSAASAVSAPTQAVGPTPSEIKVEKGAMGEGDSKGAMGMAPQQINPLMLSSGARPALGMGNAATTGMAGPQGMPQQMLGMMGQQVAAAGSLVGTGTGTVGSGAPGQMGLGQNDMNALRKKRGRPRKEDGEQTGFPPAEEKEDEEEEDDELFDGDE